jgi:hypothetical protein
MQGRVNTFGLPKRGAADSEYEDACQVADDDTHGGDLRIVVADGASESMLARRWAWQLVTLFAMAVEDVSTLAGFSAAYQRAADTWEVEVAQYKQEREERNFPIQWYEEPGLAKGAYSTLLVADFRRGLDGQFVSWTAASIGDSCLFQVRDRELYSRFPIDSSEDFDNQPPLLNSHGTSPEVLDRYLTLADGELEPEDICFLATDALSAWFLKTFEAGGEPWRMLGVLDERAPDEFAELIGKLRDDGTIKDDDTTLVSVDFR